MFTEILRQERLEKIYDLFQEEGESSVGGFIIDIINELEKKMKKHFLEMVRVSATFNIFKIRKQKIELEKSFDEIEYFYNWLEKRDMIYINIANMMLSKILESLAEEIRKTKERETAFLEVLAS